MSSFKSIFFFILLLFSCGSANPAAEIRTNADAVDNFVYANSFMTLNKKSHMFDPVVKLNMDMQLTNFYGIPLEKPILITTGSATGFVFKYNRKTKKSYIMTNDHFCSHIYEDPSFMINVETSSLMKQKKNSNLSLPATVEFSDPSYDLCVLSVDRKLTTAFFEPFDYKLRPMDKIKIIGGPMGVFPIIMDTYFSQYIPREYGALGEMLPVGNNFLMISGMILPGHSGSPIFNSDGRVIGVVFAGNQSRGVSIYGGLGIPLMDVRDFLTAPELQHIF